MCIPLYLGTTIDRIDYNGDILECDVLVEYRAVPRKNGEYDFMFVGAAFDGGAPDDADWHMMSFEVDELRGWFALNWEKAAEQASKALAGGVL